MIISAFASTCGSLVSNQIGAGKADSVVLTVHQHIKLAFAFVIPLSLLFAVFPKTVLGIYTDMPELIGASVPSLWVFCTTTLFTAASNVYFQSVSGTGNTKMAFILEFCTLFIYAAYITVVILIMRLDVAWCWTSEHVYGGFLLLFCSIYLHRGKWKSRKI